GPLFYWLSEAWCNLFGYSEAALRWPAAIYGILAVAAMYGLGRVLCDERTGLIAALLMALNPYAIHYSQEARPYSLFLLAAIGSFYFAARLGQRGSARDAGGYVFSTLAALYAHPYGPFLLAIHAGMYFSLRGSPRFPALHENHRRIRQCAVAILILYSPQLLRFGKHFFIKGEGYSNPTWIRVPTLADLAITVRGYFMLPLLSVLAAALILALLVAHRRTLRDDFRELIALLSIPIGLVLLPWITSQVLTPVYRPRYTIGALAGVVLLLAWLIARLPIRWRRWILIPLALLHTVPLYAYYTLVDKEPWRETAQVIRSAAQPGDVVLMNPWWSSRMLTYYLPQNDLLPVEQARSLDDVRRIAERAQRIWLVTSYFDEKVPRDSVRRVLASGGNLRRTVRVNELVRMNPWALRMKPIDVLLYDRTTPCGRESGVTPSAAVK
ncbi:MAG: glycosyltransferase family 39 protein, partial [bacterium]|nr:glycosyltransferase family 39 protein [bacterium]